jgi:hypothetical protein
MRGNSEIKGQDVDVPYVVKPATTDGERITECRVGSRPTDYATIELLNPQAPGNRLWQVLDPVNANKTSFTRSGATSNLRYLPRG